MDDKFKIIYDETEEDCPILKGTNLNVCLFRGYYFKGRVDNEESKGKLHEWENYSEYEGSQSINYLFSELIPAFADNMDELHTLVSVFPKVLEEFLNSSLRFYSRKPIFSVEQLNLTRDTIEELPYKNQLYLRAYVKSRELNTVALKYLVSEDLMSTYRYLPDYEAEINNAIDVYNIDHGTLYGLEQLLFAIDKEFDSKIRLCDASGLRYLVVKYLDWLQAGKQHPADKVKTMSMFEGK